MTRMTNLSRHVLLIALALLALFPDRIPADQFGQVPTLAYAHDPLALPTTIRMASVFESLPPHHSPDQQFRT